METNCSDSQKISNQPTSAPFGETLFLHMIFEAVTYHFSMLAADVLLLHAVWKSAPTNVFRLFGLCVTGCALAVVLGIDHPILVSHGLAFHGSVFLLGSALLMRRQKMNDKKRFVFPLLVFLFGLVYLGLCIEALVIEPTWLRVRHYTIESDKITKPMRIGFIADIQTDQIGAYERRTLELLQSQNADLILLGGDYLQARNKEQEEQLYHDFNALLKEVGLKAPLGVYAVQGNQENGVWFDWHRFFEDTGIETVAKTNTITAGEIRVTFLGMYNSFREKRFPDPDAKGRFRVILGHAPCFALVDQDAELLLAGHTHGGQIWIPGFGPVWTATKGLPRKWASGRTTLPNGSTLIVSNGSGMERGRAPRVRLFCQPDIVVIDLRPSEPRR